MASASVSGPAPESDVAPLRGDPTWIAPALTVNEVTRKVGKTPIFFGPPLAILADGQKYTLEIQELGLEVSLTRFDCAGLDKPALEAKLRAASYADLVAVVESLGF